MIEIIELFSSAITNFISFVGYIGIFILMALESTATPVPSEMVMPFAGYLAGTGKFSMPLVIIAGTLGCLFGSTLSYFAGMKWGETFVKRFGKYLLISDAEMKWTERWFKEHGDKTILISRFLPVVRHLISIPAGIARMNFIKFITYTLIGSFMWVTILAYAGLILGEKWGILRQFTEKISIVILLIIAIAAVALIIKHRR
ncbi:DedA family protein [Candidatus Woesearchaeota archaeon]|nr:DedA family protein [Candidatus Woesearchaeota archaeon]